jgi:histidine triad (HIT) family protein
MPAQECIFCRIARGELEAHVVHADDAHLVFLDHRPLFAGHCLIIPRAHVETLLDLPEAAVAPLFLLVQRVSRAVVQAADAEGVFNAINNRVSQSVPHLHVHAIPRRKKDGMKGFYWPRYTYSGDAEMAQVRDAIKAALETPR